MTTPPPDSLEAALVAFQAEIPQVKKDKTANVRSDKGNYSYTYADLADMVQAAYPVLARHGLAFTAKPTLNADGRFVLAYRLVHGPTRQEDVGEIMLPTQGTPQAVGAAITYAKRQALSAVTGIVADEDNDAHDGSEASTGYQRQPQRGTPPANPAAEALAALRKTCADNGFDLNVVADRFVRDHGVGLRDCTDPDQIEKFRQSLYALPTHELRAAPADDGGAEEPA